MSENNLEKKVEKKKFNKNIIFIGIIALMGILLFATPILQQKGILLQTVFTIFMGVFLQGVPFLILGVLLSSAIQIFIPKGWLEKVFPKNPFGGMVTGVVAGFFLPVCDCASIPVFKSLLKKGVPLPAAVCFMAAAPIVNPVVLISTYYAFNCDVRAVIYRTGLGIICSFLIGLSFSIRKPMDFLKDNSEDSIFCACGCYGGKRRKQRCMGENSIISAPCPGRVLQCRQIPYDWNFYIGSFPGYKSGLDKESGEQQYAHRRTRYDFAVLFTFPLLILGCGGGEKYVGSIRFYANAGIFSIWSNHGHQKCADAERVF
ncbi:MAG: permease [Muricomes sp.]